MSDDNKRANAKTEEAGAARERYADRLRRAQGCLLGQLSGDALGSMVEFQSRVNIARKYPEGLRKIGPSPVWGTVAGQPTDDSEMALALARSILPKGYYEEAAARAYGDWRLSEPFDIGNTTRQAVDAIVRAISEGVSASQAAHSAANTHSEANGALMRQSPLAIWGSWLKPDVLEGYVRADTCLTHPNRVCQDASALFVVTAAATIREGLDGHAAYNFALEWSREHGSSSEVTKVLEAAAGNPPNYERHEGHVLVALQNVFYQAIHARTLEEGVVQTVMGGGDTDTNAAIAGALLGAIFGVDGIPVQWKEAVLNCRPELGAPGIRRPRPEEYWPADVLELADRLLMAGVRSNYRWEKANDPRTTEELIAQALSAEGHDDDRYWEAINVLWYRANPEILHRMERLCVSLNAAERELGANVLSQLGTNSDVFHDERLQELLSLLIRETEPDVLSATCIALGHMYDARANEPIMRLKDHPDEDVRNGVALGLTGDLNEGAITTLIQLSTDVDADVRDWATFRLGVLEETTNDVLEALAARTADEDDDTRAEAIVGLARKKDRRGVEPLIEYLSALNAGDEDWAYIKGLLYEAAGELADPRLCPALLRIKSRITDDKYLADAIEKCGCGAQ